MESSDIYIYDANGNYLTGLIAPSDNVTAVVTQDGVSFDDGDSSSLEYRYTGDKTFVGIALVSNHNNEADYKVGDTFQVPFTSGHWVKLYVIEESSEDEESSEETTLTTITYNGNTIASLSEGKSATIHCNGAMMNGDIVVDGASDITYNGALIASLTDGQKATLPCSGKVMQGDVVVLTDTAFYILNPLNGATISTDYGGQYQYQLSKKAKKVTLSGYGSDGKAEDTSDTKAYVYVEFGDGGGIYAREENTNTDDSIISCTADGFVSIADATCKALVENSNTIYVSFEDEAGNIISDTFIASYRNGHCFAKNTPITLANRTRKLVQDITYDDVLLVWDFDNGCYSSAKPLWIKKMQLARSYYHLVFSNGKTLDVVGGRGKAHRIYCLDTNRFEYANECEGKSIVTEDGIVTLVSCDIISDTVEYYNIITDYHMNLYANGVLSSTGFSNIYPVENMRYVKEERTLIPIDALDNCPEKYYYGMRIGEQVNYTIERLNEKIKGLIANAVENRQ